MPNAREYFKQAGKRKTLGKFDAETENLYSQAAALNPKYWREYLKYLSHTKPRSDELLHKYEEAIAAQKKPDAELFAAYARILNEMGNRKLALEYHACAKPALFKDYLGINMIVPNNNAGLFAELKNHEKDFEKLIMANKNSFCIVGNSADELGTDNGEKIDRHNLVIRFNNFSNDRKFLKDYGSKTDIWVRSSEGSDVINRDISPFRLIMFSGGNFIHNNKSWKLIRKYAKTKPVGFFPDHLWHELITELKAPPSAGLLALYSIHKLTGTIPATSVYGFSKKTSTRAHYFDEAKPGIRHNWAKEKEILATIIK